jgi:hypothetical protein
LNKFSAFENEHDLPLEKVAGYIFKLDIGINKYFLAYCI